MKRHTLISALAVFVVLTHAASAQNDPLASTNFPMVGITRGQTLVLNVVAFPPTPCDAQLGFLNSTGLPVGPSQQVQLPPGQSASVALNGNSLLATFGHRMELLPIVAVAGGGTSCVASVEVVDNLLGATAVLVPGAVGFPPNPAFGMLGLTVLQTVRLNVVAFPPTPCIGQIGFTDKNGNPIGGSMNVQLGAGQATFLDLPGNTLVSALGQRAEVIPVVTPVSPATACIASAEVYGNAFGVTAVYFPPTPCASSSTSCATWPPVPEGN
ncbi:MAG: hypothetical protein ABSF25_26525 [Bryobacteraceae bacterium]|jgi:hypothetical protein